MAELRARMSSSEFSRWLVYFHEEGHGPDAELQRWAVTMAALANGPVSKKSGGLWTAGDFMPRPYAQAQPPKPATGADARKHLAAQRAARKAAAAARK